MATSHQHQDQWAELGRLIVNLQPGQGVEVPPALKRDDIAFRVRRAFPGYLLAKREGHVFILRPLDVNPPPDGAGGMYTRGRQREEMLAKLVDSGRYQTLAELGKALGVSTERARQLLRRLGIKLPKGKYAETQCRDCGETFNMLASRLKRYKRLPRCPICLARRTEVIKLTCLRCRREWHLPRRQAERLVAPFCSPCWEHVTGRASELAAAPTTPKGQP